MIQCISHPVKCTNFNRKTILICVPPKVACNLVSHEGLLVGCGDEWNCNLPCNTDKQYYNPYKIGDKIYFQTQFYSGRTCPPTGTVTVELCSASGTTQSVTAQTMLGWTGSYSIQNICIDTSQAIFSTVKCWNLKISFNGEECCTQHFREKDSCIEDLLTVEGKWKCQDHFNNWYQELGDDCISGDKIDYINKISLCATLKKMGTTGEIIENEAEVKSGSIMRTYYRIMPIAKYGKLPPYIDCFMTNLLSANNGIYINGERYETDAVERSTPGDSNSMFWRQWEVYRESEIKGCC